MKKNAPRPPIRWGASKVNQDITAMNRENLVNLTRQHVSGVSVSSYTSTNISGDVR